MKDSRTLLESNEEGYFSPPLACAKDYPNPIVTMTPNRHGIQHDLERPRIDRVSRRVLFSHARNVFGFLASEVLGKRGTIWLPAYHCPALVEPFLWAGHEVKYFNVKADLSPDLQAIPSHANTDDVCVLIRYFGHDCGVQAATAQLQAAGYMVIEDLAHAAHTDKLFGDLGVTSLKKFYPVSTGAELLLADKLPNKHKIYQLADRWLLSHMVAEARHFCQRIADRVTGISSRNGYRYFQQRESRFPIHPSDSAELLRHNHDSCARRRYDIYERMNNSLQSSKIGSSLFGRKKMDSAPYVLPFLLHDAEYFGVMRNAGIPLYRWEELADTNCKISADYRSHLVQLPCHQDLSDSQVDEILNICEQIDARI